MIRRFGVVTLVALVVTALVALQWSAPPANADTADISGSTDIATCLQSARSLSALFLFDQSGSLNSSDPSGVRYDGLRVALESLSRVDRGDGAPLSIEAAVSAFDDSYYAAENVVDWTQLNVGGEDTAKVIDEIVDKASERTQPTGNTNFTEALTGAWNDLEDRGQRGTCRVVFWFTDGADGVNTVGSQPCMPDSGLVDQMRRAGIVIVGLQLQEPTDDLRAISTGQSNTVQCGRHPIPSDWAGGVYIQADDSAALRRLFGTLGNIIRGCTPQDDRRGRIDPGVRAMNVTINTPAQVNMVRLDAPDGTVISANPTGSTTAGGYAAVAESDASYASVTVDFPPGKGAGEWLVSAGQAIPPTDMEFCVFSGLHLERVDPDIAPVAEGTAQLIYQAVDSDGNVGNLAEYQAVAPGVAVVAANGDLRKATASVDGNRIVVAVDTLPVDARLDVKLNVALTTVSGLALTPLAIEEGVGFTLSKAYPTISPIDQLDLGVAQKSAATAATLTLAGSPLGPSQVCFDQPTDFSVPADQTGAALDMPTGCIDLAQSESRDIAIGISPIEPTVGGGGAILPIRLVPATGSDVAGQEAPVTLPVLWRYENPRDPVVLWVVVALVCIISVLLPLAALGLANWITARFDVKGLRGEQIPILVGPDGPRRVNTLTNAPDRVLTRDHTKLIPVRNRRRFTVDHAEFSSRGTLNPFRAPTFTVRPTSGQYRVMSSVSPPGDGSNAGAVPGLGFVVVVVVSNADLQNPAFRDVPATLIVLIRDPKLTSAALDPLMNSSIDWSVITDRWRRDDVADVSLRPGTYRSDDGFEDRSGAQGRSADDHDDDFDDLGGRPSGRPT